MNSNWKNRPTTIDYISQDINYIVSIDESGTSNLKQVISSAQKGVAPPASEHHFTVTAASIAMNDFDTARNMVMDLKKKYWNNALFTYKGKEKRVCFHSREIRGKRDAFNPEFLDYDAFILDLSNMMQAIPLKLYASHINKVQHVKKYIYPIPPYDLCMTFVLERIIRDMKDGETCIIILESRGKAEDKELLDYIKRLMNHGTNYCPAWAFQRIKGIYFNPKWCAMANDKMSYWELELADLCAYPIQKYFVYDVQDKAFRTLLPKISHYPNYWGKGLKSFP